MRSIIFLSLLIISSCAHKRKILDVPMVSMKYESQPKDTQLVEKGSVEGEFCLSMSDTGNIGLIDNAIVDAQNKGKVDFIGNASFYFKHGFLQSTCMTVEGTGYVVKKQ